MGMVGGVCRGGRYLCAAMCKSIILPLPAAVIALDLALGRFAFFALFDDDDDDDDADGADDADDADAAAPSPKPLAASPPDDEAALLLLILGATAPGEAAAAASRGRDGGRKPAREAVERRSPPAQTVARTLATAIRRLARCAAVGRAASGSAALDARRSGECQTGSPSLTTVVTIVTISIEGGRGRRAAAFWRLRGEGGAHRCKPRRPPCASPPARAAGTRPPSSGGGRSSRARWRS